MSPQRVSRSMRIRERCECGGSLDVSSNPPTMALDIAKQWDTWHEGDGHRRLRIGERRPRRRIADHDHSETL